MFNFLKRDYKLKPTLSNGRMPKKKESLESLWRLTKIMLENLTFEDVVGKVVNSILVELGYLKLGYRIVVLTLLDEEKGVLKRIALSQTEEARKALEASAIPFHRIEIPISAKDNFLIKALTEKKPQVTTYWPDIFRPVLTDQQALINQKAAGIKTSLLYPIVMKGKPLGTLIFSLNKDYKDVTEEERDLIEGFSDLVGLAVQNSMLFTSLQITGKKLEQANQRLKELDRLKDEFVSVASHELRTPMTAIRSYAWMALHKSDIPLSQKLERYLYRTLVSTERLISLVNDMLNVSRIESGRIEINPKSFDIVALVKDIMEEVKVKADEKKLQLISLEQKIPAVFADPDKVHEVLLNLVGNALKFSYPGGTVTISFFTDGQMVDVSVRDSGCGIAKEDLSKLFHKFSRLDNSYTSVSTSGGTGLGLYISKSLIELMHGKIWVSSEGVDKGSTFSFSLPIANEQVLKHSDEFSVKAKGDVKPLEAVAL